MAHAPRLAASALVALLLAPPAWARKGKAPAEPATAAAADPAPTPAPAPALKAAEKAPELAGFDLSGLPLVDAGEVRRACERALACKAVDGGAGDWKEALDAVKRACGAARGAEAWPTALPTRRELSLVPDPKDQSRCKAPASVVPPPPAPVVPPAFGAAAFGGFQADPLLSGLSDFLVERAQVELSAWVYSSLDDQLCGGSSDGEPARGGVLPATCDLVRANTLRFTSAGIGVLRGAARADLRTLPRRVVEQAHHMERRGVDKEQRDGDKEQRGVDEGQARRDALRFAAVLLRMAELTADGADPLDVISAWPRAEAWPAPGNEAGPASITLYAAGIFSAAIERQGANALLPAAGDELTAMPDFVLASLINLQEREALTPLMKAWGLAKVDKNPWENLIGPLQDGHRGLLRAVRRISAAADVLAGLPADAPAERRLAAGLQVALGAMDLAGQGLQLGLSVVTDGVARERLTLAQGRLGAVRGVTAGLAAGDLGAVGSAVTPLLLELQREVPQAQSELNPDLVRAITFAGALGAAGDAQSAQAAIEAFVSPPGGYARKRLDYAGQSRYLTLQSYVGAGGGGELLFRPKAGVEPSWVVAPMVSLGAELGGSPKKGEGSFGVYVPVIDLGGLAAVRFDGGVQAAPVSLRQVLSPGVYGVYGFPRVPFSFGVGGALRPGLREGNAGELNALQLGLFFAMDLVLLP